MELIIQETADLLTVAAILVKNGYTVKKGKKRRAEGKNTYWQILIVEKESQ